MATSGTITQYFRWANGPNSGPVAQSSSVNAELALNFNWSIMSQSVRDNTSKLYCSVSIKLLHLDSVNAKYVSMGSNFIATGIIVGNSGTSETKKDFVLNIDGAAISTLDNISHELREGNTYQLWSGTITVEHNADGNKTVPIDTQVFIRSQFLDAITHSSAVNNAGSILTLSGSFTPDKITRAAVIESFPTYFTDEDMPLLKYYNPAGADAVELKAGISFSAGRAMEVPLRDLPKNGEEYYFEFTEADKAAIWAATIDNGLVTTDARVYISSLVPKASGGYEEGYTYFRSRIEIINFRPEIELLLADVNDKSASLTGNAEILINGLSNVYYDIDVSTKKGASISSHLFRNGNYVDASEYWGTIYGVSNPVFYGSITDSRGYTTTQTIDLAAQGKWVPYIPLSCSVQHKPLDSSGKLRVTIFGKYFSGSFGKVTNSFKLSYRATRVGDTNYTWVSLGTIADSKLDLDEEGNYSYTFDITGLDYTSQYQLIVQVKDEVYERNVYPPTIPAAKILFDWSDEDFAFKIPVTIEGYDVPTLVSQGTSGGWGYKKWSDGIYECWRTVELSVILNNASVANWYSSGEISGTNLNLPITFIERPVVNVTLNPTGNTWALLCPSNTGGSTSKTGSYQLLATYSHTTSRAYIFSYYVRGKWK